MSKTAVVILNYNGKDWLQKFIPNVLENSKEDADVVIIDNYSSDGSVEFIKTNFDNQLQLIQLNQNFGFAGGYNKGLLDLAYDFYILLIKTKHFLNTQVQLVGSLINMDTHFAEEEYLQPLKKIASNTTILKKFFGHREHVFSFALQASLRKEDLMKVFLLIWRKLIYAGD